jgi:cysteinyl-tRNA synthetase
MVAGARIEVAPYKGDPGDFVLWKPSSADQPGWDSPWGRGRPGWHIECSAMSAAHLGESFDIHGGGLDLIFPHHENELAQSEAAHGGKPFARFWVHNGFLSVDSAKMSKSLGNFVTVHELLEQGMPGEAIRLALLATHYRDPLDWTDERLEDAKAALDRWYRALSLGSEEPTAPEQVPAKAVEALNDDLNTPQAITYLHEVAGAVFRTEGASERLALQKELVAAGTLLGLLTAHPLQWLQRASLGEAERIEMRIVARTRARKERRFADADHIRAELAEEGVILEDRPDGTTEWRRA